MVDIKCGVLRGLLFVLLVVSTVPCVVLAQGTQATGSFSITDLSPGAMLIHCTGLADNNFVFDYPNLQLGFNDMYSSNVLNNIQIPLATTTVSCTFLLTYASGPRFQARVTVWSDNGGLAVPVACTDCTWKADPSAFLVFDPVKQEYVVAAHWIPTN